MFFSKKPAHPGLDVSFSDSVQVAMTFVFAAANRRLPAEIQRHARLNEALFVGHPLMRIQDISGVERKELYLERDLEFYFGTELLWVNVYLRKNIQADNWRVMSMTYPMWYKTGHVRWLKRYQLVVEPHQIYHSKVENSGFLDID